jgi:hypothetical protein
MSDFEGPFHIGFYVVNVIFLTFGSFVAMFWSYHRLRWLLVGGVMACVGWFSIAFSHFIFQWGS